MNSLLQQLNPVQQQAVSTIDGPVMIVAGAGSGKTRVLTYRIAYLIHSNIKPYEILALTFTNKAAREMKERIHSIVGPQATNVWAGTFHSIFARILRQECEVLGYQRSFTIYDTDDCLSLIKNIMSAINLSAQQFNPRAVYSRISGAKNQMISPAEYENIAKDIFEQKVAQVYHEYQQRLYKSNSMDFDDLLLKPIELFQSHQHILEKYQHRFRHILVDEYQDTNRAQYTLINLLASRFKNICVVGDDAQSIYSFRGADIRNILDFERDYPEAQTFRLEQNYRSTKTILAAADAVIKRNKNQIHKTLWTENIQGDGITLLETEDDKDEGMQIVHRIKEQCTKYKYDLKDFAVLYRTNAQSRSIEDAMRRAGIPYIIVGGIEFYKRKEIKDVLAYLRILVNPKDEESMLRIINYPTRGIGETTIEKIREYAKEKNLSFFDALHSVTNIPSLTERNKQSIIQFIRLLDKYLILKKEFSTNELVRTLVDELGILKMYKDEGTLESLGKWENIQELLSAISEFIAAKPDATLETFLEEVALVSATDNLTDNKNTITLMTLHAAKGLEFPVVFIAGTEEGLLPLYQVALDVHELEEERRLFYVGITRAMKKLFLTHSRIRYRFGDLTYPILSRFVEEIENSLIIKETSRPTIPKTTSRNAFTKYENKKSFYKKNTEENFIFRDEEPTYDESQEQPTLKIGSLVQHEVFGKGKILHLTGNGEAAKAVVLFQSVGQKNLMLKFAHLKLL